MVLTVWSKSQVLIMLATRVSVTIFMGTGATNSLVLVYLPPLVVLRILPIVFTPLGTAIRHRPLNLPHRTSVQAIRHLPLNLPYRTSVQAIRHLPHNLPYRTSVQAIPHRPLNLPYRTLVQATRHRPLNLPHRLV